MVQIKSEEIGSQHYALQILIPKEEYLPELNDSLKKYAKTAIVKGFRPGMAPFSMVKRIYGDGMLAEVLDKMVTENLNKYLVEQKWNIIAQPLVTNKEQLDVSMQNESDFLFHFEVGLCPGISLMPPPPGEVFRFKIIMEPLFVETEIALARARLPVYSDEDISGPNSILDGIFTELTEEGEVKEGGVVNEVSFLPDVITKEEYMPIFYGLAKDRCLDIAFFEVFNREPDALKKLLLGLKPGYAAALGTNFRLLVKGIRAFRKADLNQEFFDKVLGPGKVENEEQFYKEMEFLISQRLLFLSDNRLMSDLHHYLSFHLNIPVPAQFLRKLIIKNAATKYSEEELDKEMPKLIQMVRWNMVRDRVVEDEKIEILEEEIQDYAYGYMEQRMRSYGIGSLGPEFTQEMAMDYLRKKENRYQAIEEVQRQKVLETLMEKWTFVEKEVTMEEFKNSQYHAPSHSHADESEH